MARSRPRQDRRRVLNIISPARRAAVPTSILIDIGRSSLVSSCFGFFLGVLVIALHGSAWADSLSLITSAASQDANDSVRWSQLGGNTQALGSSANASSSSGIAVTLGFTGPDSILSVVCPSSSCSWSGDGLAAGDTLIWTSNGTGGGNGPVTVTFARAIAGAGAYLQADGPTAFIAQIQAFNGSNFLGSFTESSDAEGDAIYLGIQDNTGPNITSVVLSLVNAQGPLSDFAFDALNLKLSSNGNGTPTAVPTATPAPPTRTATSTATPPPPTPTTAPTAGPGPSGFDGATSTTTTRSIVPAGVQTGDLLLAFYSYWSSASATAPAGWQLLQSASSSGSGTESLWYHFATSADTPGTPYTWTFGGLPYQSGGMLAFHGIDTAAPQDGFCLNRGSSSAPSLCSFSTSYSNDIYLGFFSTENIALILPGDLTPSVVNQYANGSWFGSAAGSKSLGTAGIVPADAGSMSSGGWATVALALKRANSGPPSSTPVPTPVPTAVPTSLPTPVPTATATAAAGSITLIATSSTTSSRATVPAGVQAGDLLLAFYSYWSSSSATAPSGWQSLQSSTLAGSGVETVWYRIATGSDVAGSSYAWAFSGTPYEAGGMLAYRGVSPSAPNDGSCISAGRSANPSWCEFNTTSAGDKYVALVATENVGLALPSDLRQESIRQYANGSNFGVAAGDKALGNAGSVAAESGSMNIGGWATIAIALRPGGGGAPAPTPTPVPSAISYLSSTATTGSSMIVPSGVQNGDLLLAFYSYWHSATASAPPGWNLLETETSSASGTGTVWYRVANNDAPGSSYAWTFNGPGPYASGEMIAYRGVSPISALDGQCLNSGINSNPSLCSMTTSSSNDIYVGFYTTENTGLSLPNDLTVRQVQQYSNGGHFGSAIGDKFLGAAGPRGADVGSMNSGGWETIAVALKHQ